MRQRERDPTKKRQLPGGEPHAFRALAVHEMTLGEYLPSGASLAGGDSPVRPFGVGCGPGRRAGRDPGGLDIGDSLLGAIAPERDAARRAARRLASFYLPSMPPRCRHATPSTPGTWPLVNEAFAAGDVRRALALTPDAVADRTMVAGTPDDWIEWLNTAYTSTE